ncbi:energy transducer TonB [Vibrio sp. ZSDE26]|uniref:Energy transducer TonB n=1 Tax=Vibrio amylolyticus TaxID=2847292 RepID=A0A9X1XJ51_9VIBR|nr:energy transducer TonB [Vibrio amylolyticus]MCK6264192.1 energy transducer TonB [Vibrio amylolyticus]
MNVKRYAIFAGLSLAIHGVAFSASYKPMLTPAIPSTIGTTVNIQFLSAPEKNIIAESKDPEKADNTPKSKQRQEPKKEVKTAEPDARLKARPAPKSVTKTKAKPILEDKALDHPVETEKTNTTIKSQPRSKPIVNSKPIKQEVTKEAPEVVSETGVKTDNNVSPEIDTPSMMNAQSHQQPQMIKKPRFEARPSAIRYPSNAKRRNIQGVVLVEVWLDEYGDQTKLVIVDSSGHQVLDSAALKGISKWQFSHHQDGNQAIAHRVQIPIQFKLD